MVDFCLEDKKIWVAGHRGMFGSAVCRRLSEVKNTQIITVNHSELDLTRQEATEDWVAENRPDVIINCAGKVGGIEANRNQPADFIYENLQMGFNLLHTAFKMGVTKFVNLGSSCFYPKDSKQPISEKCLLTNSLENTNEAYALAKIATLKLGSYYRLQYNCDFIGVVPTNLYGPEDNFDAKNGHVIAALICKFHQAITEHKPFVELWGSGKPLREFMYVDDAADGLVFLLQYYSGYKHINLSGCRTVSINKLAQVIGGAMGFCGEIRYDDSKPDGMMKKSLDNSLIAKLGWQPKVSLQVGIKLTIENFMSQVSVN